MNSSLLLFNLSTITSPALYSLLMTIQVKKNSINQHGEEYGDI